MERQGRLNSTILFLSLFFPLPDAYRVEIFYRLFSPLFYIATGNSGILNLGYSEDKEAFDLVEAQRALVRLTTADLPHPGRWLDVGCGIGGPACLIARENPDITITGINISQDHIAAARNCSREGGMNSRVEFRFGNALDIPFPDQCFEGVYAVETAFHYPDKARFSCEAYRVLRSGGCFAVADMVLGDQRPSFFEKLMIAFGKRCVASREIFTSQTWHHALRGCGFSDIHVRDITAQTLSHLNLWQNKLRSHEKALSRSYPSGMLYLFQRGLDYINKKVQTGFINYILVTARRPA
jgi:cyclopropane fatty-acyl-phospholipid synthase-like methyltransferase